METLQPSTGQGLRRGQVGRAGGGGMNKAVLLVLLYLAAMRGVAREIPEVEARGHRLRAVSGGLQARCNALCSSD